MSSPITVAPLIWHKLESPTASSELGPNPLYLSEMSVVSGKWGNGVYTNGVNSTEPPDSSLFFPLNTLATSWPRFSMSLWIKTDYSVVDCEHSDKAQHNSHNILGVHLMYRVDGIPVDYEDYGIAVAFYRWNDKGFEVVGHNPRWYFKKSEPSSGLSWSANVWNHIVFQWDYTRPGGKAWELWLNGTKVLEDSWEEGDLSPFPSEDGGRYLYASLGWSWAGGTIGTKKLAMDNFMMFDYYLDSTQIAWLYANESWTDAAPARRRVLRPLVIL